MSDRCNSMSNSSRGNRSSSISNWSVSNHWGSNRLNMDVRFSGDLNINISFSWDFSMNIWLSSDLLMHIWLSSNLDINIRLSSDFLMHIGFGSNLLMDIGLSSNFLMDVRLSLNLDINIWLSCNFCMYIRLSSRVKISISNRCIINSSISSGNWGGNSSNWLSCITISIGASCIGSSSYRCSSSIAIGSRVGITSWGNDTSSCRGQTGKDSNKGLHYASAAT